jgi:hypothetical protein
MFNKTEQMETREWITTNTPIKIFLSDLFSRQYSCIKGKNKTPNL